MLDEVEDRDHALGDVLVEFSLDCLLDDGLDGVAAELKAPP